MGIPVDALMSRELQILLDKQRKVLHQFCLWKPVKFTAAAMFCKQAHISGNARWQAYFWNPATLLVFLSIGLLAL